MDISKEELDIEINFLPYFNAILATLKALAELNANAQDKQEIARICQNAKDMIDGNPIQKEEALFHSSQQVVSNEPKVVLSKKDNQ